MTDQTFRTQDTWPTVAAAVRRQFWVLWRWQLKAGFVWALTVVAALGLGAYYWMAEGSAANILYTCAVTLMLAAGLVLISRRVLFATVLVTALVVIVVTVAAAKRQIMNSVVHAYDLFFYLSSWSTVSFLWSDYRRYVVAFAAALLAAALLGWIAFRIDGTRVPRRSAAVATLVSAALVFAAAAVKGERRHMLFHYEGLYVSSFFASWAETAETLWRGQLIEAAARWNGPLFSLPQDCTPVARPPHIILIHQESMFPPTLFPALKHDASVDPFFRSHDGKLHKLRVETYGGASWLTEFSLLAGVSTQAFGGMRHFVQTVMENRVRDTLPQALARCGYRNVIFYPMLKNFVSNARFYQSVGLNEIFDLKDQGAQRVNERDRFYYANAMAMMARHFETSQRPLFTFIQTMAAHWPYDTPYMPEVEVPGGGPGTHPELSEFLRRVSMARLDYEFLTVELARRFPDQQFLIVHYGDHQPMATRVLLGYQDDTEAEDVALRGDSVGFLTYYAVDGVNYRPTPLPAVATLDVPYLGTVILEAARLPLSDAYRERQRLLAACDGRYYGCARHDQILAFHRRLIDSRLMDAR